MAEIFLLPPWTVLKESGKATWKFIMHSSHIKVSYLFWFLELTLKKKKTVLLSENVKRLKSRDIRGLEKNNHLMTDCLRIAAFLLLTSPSGAPDNLLEKPLSRLNFGRLWGQLGRKREVPYVSYHFLFALGKIVISGHRQHQKLIKLQEKTIEKEPTLASHKYSHHLQSDPKQGELWQFCAILKFKTAI